MDNLTSEFNMDSIRTVYFVGIGGIAMSAAAGIAREKGFDVLGSDSKDVYAPAKDVLDREKINYKIGYGQKNISEAKADLFIISAGEDLNNPEVKFIYENEFPHMSFAQFMYELSKDNLRVVVAGTHGKSTTTALLGHVLKSLDDSSYLAGAVLQNSGSNFYHGDGHYFVFEGDEYKAEFDDPTPKFHYYKADILVLTNLEWDHPDIFPNIESLLAEFEQLIADMPADGLIVYNADDQYLPKLVHASNVSSLSFGIENEADFKIENIQYGPEFTSIAVQNKFSKNVTAHLMGVTEEYKLQLPGKLNCYNALAVIALLRSLGFQQDQIALDIISFLGIKRRFELVGKVKGITIIDDYAHHPTAIRETLAAAKLRYFSVPVGEGFKPSPTKPNGKLWAVFEPHTFSRTQAVLPELVTAFNDADEVLISEIYPAREKASEHSISSQDVVSRFIGSKTAPTYVGANYKTPNVRLVHDKKNALAILKSELRPNDVVLVMAVGSFNRLAYELKDILSV